MTVKDDIINFFNLNDQNYAFVLIFALAGITILINVYNLFSQVNTKSKSAETTDVTTSLNKKFITIVVISAVVTAASVGLSIFFKNNTIIKTAGFSGTICGICGIVYSLILKYRGNNITYCILLATALLTILVIAIVDKFYIRNNNFVTV